MKKAILKAMAVVSFLLVTAPALYASEMQILVDKLVEKGILTTYEGQILVSQAKEEAAKEMAETKKTIVPAWTDNVKIKGDVRFRTQTEWGKGLGPAHQRTRQRVRARLGVEGKVNEQVKAGILAATGGSDPRSTNQTLDDNFETYDFRLDQYYINWKPEIPKEIGKTGLWLGKFKNPMTKSPILWDGDINPGGIALQYGSPKFEIGDIPFSIYSNGGMFWLDEFGTSQRDPLLWTIQGGFKADVVKDWGATVDVSAAYYDFANTQNNRNYVNAPFSAGTNTLWGGALGNTYRYDFNLIDVLFKYDSKQIGDLKFGHGVFGDFIWNAGASKNNFAWQLGGYIGEKKVSEPGQWQLKGEYRSIMRDAVPDFLPDSDFYGFTAQGTPSGGGTGGEGFVGSFKYGLMKNLVAGVNYYYSQPMSINKGLTNSYDEPYNILMFDIETKF
ncbi:MAG: putative porin [Candidatus Omnitrophota bacterium]